MPQLATDDVKANSRGLAIVNVTEALPFLKTQSSISPDALGLLATQPLPTELTATDVQYPAINSQEAIILQGTLIDMGDVHISKKIEKSEQAIEAVDTVIIKIVGFTDELEEDWERFQQSPAKALVGWRRYRSAGRTAALEVAGHTTRQWRRTSTRMFGGSQFQKLAGGKTTTELAEVVQIFARFRSLRGFLAMSTQRGIRQIGRLCGT